MPDLPSWARALPEVDLSAARYCIANENSDDSPGLRQAVLDYPNGARFTGGLNKHYRFDIASAALFPNSRSLFDFETSTVRMGTNSARTIERIFDVNGKQDVHIVGGDWLAAMSDRVGGAITDARVLIEGAAGARCRFAPDRIDASNLSGPVSGVATVWQSNGVEHQLEGEHRLGTVRIDGGKDCNYRIRHTLGAAPNTNSVTMKDLDANRLIAPTFDLLVIEQWERTGVEIVAGGAVTNPVEAAINHARIRNPGATAGTAISAVMPGSQITNFVIENPKGYGIEGSVVGQKISHGVIRWDTPDTAVGSHGITGGAGQAIRGGLTITDVDIENPGMHGIYHNAASKGRLTCIAVNVINARNTAFELQPLSGVPELPDVLLGCTARYTLPPSAGQNRTAYQPGPGSQIIACGAHYDAASASGGGDVDIVVGITGGVSDVNIPDFTLDTARVDAQLLPNSPTSGTRTGWQYPRARVTGGSTKTFPMFGAANLPAKDEPTRAYTSVATTYAAAVSDRIILADTTTAAFTLTLPSAATAGVGKEFLIRRKAGANTLTVNTGGGNIDGAASAAVTTLPLRVVSDGANYFSI